MVILNFIVSKFHFLHPETKDHHIMHELYVTFTCHRVNIPNSNKHSLAVSR
jgi:hypothetical protein